MNKLGSNIRVLIIEDDTALRGVLTRIVKLMADDVVATEDGSAGVEALGQAMFQIVVTDLKMPGVSGLDVAAWIRSNRPGLPVVVTSGFATAEDLRQITALGATLLRKPYTPNSVHAAMRRALGVLKV